MAGVFADGGARHPRLGSLLRLRRRQRKPFNPKPPECSNPEHWTLNSTHNSAFNIQNSKLKTQNSKLETHTQHQTPNQVTTENISLFIEDYDEERLERKELQEDEEEGEEGQ